MRKLYLGLMSGTSADGIDAALVDFADGALSLVATHYTPHPKMLRELILGLCHPGPDEIRRMGELDILLGEAFANAADELIAKQGLTPSDITAIGSHGQTIRHQPVGPLPFTLQIGDPNRIAAKTGITTVADFRRKDMALGGQGAPLVPAFHQAIFTSSHTHRAILNIGGIANVTLLDKDNQQAILGFDTGPGNTLMDLWVYEVQQQLRDENGAWAAQGKVNVNLLEEMLSDPYFHLPAPKSTGREYFHKAWLDKQLQKHVCSQVDVQATLAELTAVSIVNAVKAHFKEGEMIICGGGAHNTHLMKRLQCHAQPHFTVSSSKTHGIDPDWVEAIAFAWLAKQTLAHKPGNITSVTGASRACVLGGVFSP